MITTLEEATVGTTGTLVEEIWNLGAGEEVTVCVTPWDRRQEMCVQVLSGGVIYNLPYWVKIDDGEPSTLGEMIEREEPTLLRDILRPIVRKLIKQGMQDTTIPHELYEEACMILGEEK